MTKRKIIVPMLAALLTAGHAYAEPAEQPKPNEKKSESESSGTDRNSNRNGGRPVGLMQFRLPSISLNWFTRTSRIDTEEVTYLGVSASAPSPIVREQLGLKQFGLQIHYVDPDSPAGSVGLKKSDILEKIDDQLLVNAQQLAAIIRSHEPGDDVKLTIIRRGKRQELTTSLILQELPVIANIIRRPGIMLPNDVQKPVELPSQTIKGKRLRVNSPGREAVAVARDPEHTLTLRFTPEGKMLQVVDSGDNVIFEGAVNTAKERTNLPKTVIVKLQKLEASLIKAMPRKSTSSDFGSNAQ